MTRRSRDSRTLSGASGIACLLVAGAVLAYRVPAFAAAPPYAPPCSAYQVQAADAGTTTFGNRRVTQIDVINNSRDRCSLQGYPQLNFSLLSGAPSFILVNKRALDANYKTPEPARIEIGPLQRASFLLDYPKQKTRGSACVPVSNIDIVFGGLLHFGTVSLPDTIASCGIVDESPFFISTVRKAAIAGAGLPRPQTTLVASLGARNR